MKDRKLKVTCKPTLTWNNTDPNHLDINATMQFVQVDGVGVTDPPMIGAVGPSGKIDISMMPNGGNDYTENIDITFELDDSDMKNADGSKLTGKARWAMPGEGESCKPPTAIRYR